MLAQLSHGLRIVRLSAVFPSNSRRFGFVALRSLEFDSFLKTGLSLHKRVEGYTTHDRLSLRRVALRLTKGVLFLEREESRRAWRRISGIEQSFFRATHLEPSDDHRC